MSAFEVGQFIWIPDEKEVCLPVRVVNASGNAVKVENEAGKKFALQAHQLAGAKVLSEEALDASLDDLVNVQDLSEYSLLHILRIRHKIDRIYTSISSILISVNPFKMLPLYTPDVLDKYRSGYRGKPPHIFGIAFNAYDHMTHEHMDQSVVISGESGAGKSEATKLILQFLTEVSSATSSNNLRDSDDREMSPLEQQILAANPILEAFGNAKTLRNNNSSRFGKLITVNFDMRGSIVGGRIVNYLLEKSRVVFQTKGERNYHIFYQLVAAAQNDSELAASLKLSDLKDYHITSQSGVMTIDGVSDLKEFEEVVGSMDVLRYTDEDKRDVYKIVAGIMHLANMQFDLDKSGFEEKAFIIPASQEPLEVGCGLWQVDKAALATALISRTIQARGAAQVINYTKEQAQHALDAMVKKVYADLFQRMVNKINTELANEGAEDRTANYIGVLDIFGFESFAVNSFEQLCINYCNEKLQYHFNEHIFRMEMELYEEEGVEIPNASFADNSACLDMIEAKATGILAICDEEISLPKATDDTYLRKLFEKHQKHAHMIRPMTKDCKDAKSCFGVLHYAGPVYYNVTNFLDKNSDQLHVDIVNIIGTSTMSTLADIFDPHAGSDDRVSGRGIAASPKKKQTMGSQFKTQLKNLLDMLNATNPHFVRCMKPNEKKVRNVFDGPRMNDQLRYAGLLEVCRIRKMGYPQRRDFDEFYRRYKCCNLLAKNMNALITTLKEKNILKDDLYLMGNSKIFMRGDQNSLLELARDEALTVVAVKVQRSARRYIFVTRYKRFMQILKDMEVAMKERNYEKIEESLDRCAQLPWNGTHLAVVGKAKTLQLRLVEERRVEKLLKDAIASKEMSPLKSAVNAASSMSPAYTSPSVTEAKAIIKTIEAEHACKKALLDAISKRTLAAVNQALKEADTLKVSGFEKDQALALKVKLEAEAAAIAKLLEAVKGRKLEEINKAIADCFSNDIGGCPEIDQARTVLEEIRAEIAAKDAAAAERMAKEAEAEKARQEEAAAKKKQEALHAVEEELEKAMADGDMEKVNMALSKAAQVGLKSKTVTQAQSLVAGSGDNMAVTENIVAAIEALEIKKAAGIAKPDLKPLEDAIEQCKKLNNASLAEELTMAEAAYEVFFRMYKIRSDLTSSLATKNVNKMKTALAAAQNLDMDIPVMKKVKELLRKKGADGPDNGAGGGGAKAKPKTEKDKAAAMFATMGLNAKKGGGGGGGGGSTSPAPAPAPEEPSSGTFKKFTTGAAEAMEDSPASKFGLSPAPAPPITETTRGRKETIVKLTGDAVVDAEAQAAAALQNFPNIAAHQKDDNVRQSLLDAQKLLQNSPALPPLPGMDKIIAAGGKSVGGALPTPPPPPPRAAGGAGLAGRALPPPPPGGAGASGQVGRALPPPPPPAGGAVPTPPPPPEAGNAPKSPTSPASATTNDNVAPSVNAVAGILDQSFLSKGLSYLMGSSGESAEAKEAKDIEDEGKNLEGDAFFLQARFELKHYVQLRPAEDFASLSVFGTLTGFRKAKDDFLYWQNTVVPKSLMDMEPEESKEATLLHKNLLGFMGDKRMPFPAMLAHKILESGFEKEYLRDEIFCQVMKQLRKNPGPDSVGKGWQIFAMASSAFLPSADFLPHVKHFILTHKMEQVECLPVVKDYASYCLTCLETTVGNGSGFVPSAEEIQAYKKFFPTMK